MCKHEQLFLCSLCSCFLLLAYFVENEGRFVYLCASCLFSCLCLFAIVPFRCHFCLPRLPTLSCHSTYIARFASWDVHSSLTTHHVSSVSSLACVIASPTDTSPNRHLEPTRHRGTRRAWRTCSTPVPTSRRPTSTTTRRCTWRLTTAGWEWSPSSSG